ncbi:MAG: hypothetical protein DMF19_06775 [Verrucomicrobia bacterium]|nr:MAG: hypothetical protein DMF19_06775 [Verrucomicrobiota bacterium]
MIFVDELNPGSDGKFSTVIFENSAGFRRPIQMTTELWPDKDLINMRIDNKTPVGDARAVKGRPGRIGTVDNAISVMGISFAHRIFPLRRRILFGGFLRSDRRCDSGATRALFRNLA